MLHAIITSKATADALTELEQVLEGAAESSEPISWTFPSGHTAAINTKLLRASAGKVAVASVDWVNRKAHLVCIPGDSGRLVPDVEINIPKEHARRIAGLFASSKHASDTRIHLLHRGLVNIFRGPIPKQTTLDAFSDLVEDCRDGALVTSVIYVSPVVTAEIGQSLYDFAHRMREHKSRVRAQRDASVA